MKYDYTYYSISIFVTYVLIIIATWITISNWKHLKKTKEWIFLPFFCFTILTELGTQYFVWVKEKNPSFIIDFYTLIAMLVAIYWFYSYLKYKWLALFSTILMLLSYLGSIIYVENYNYELPAIVIAAALIITLTVFTFFNSILKANDRGEFKMHRPFWISVGFFVLHINAMPFVLFLPNLQRLSWQVSSVLIFINMIVYGCFIYGLRLKPILNE